MVLPLAVTVTLTSLGKIPQRAFPAGALPLYLFAPVPFTARVTTLRVAVDVRLRGAFPAPEARRSGRARGVEASRVGDHDCVEPRYGLGPAPAESHMRPSRPERVLPLYDRMAKVGTRRVRNASTRGWKRLPFDVSLHDLAAPSITVRPEQTLHTCFAFRVVNAFLMRAADDAIKGRH